jgi:drug/metabolite transporter (DMT)-like permease
MPDQDVSHRTSTMAATRLGIAAIGLWASLASLTTLAGPIPPFQLSAMTFVLGTLVGLGYAKLTRQPLSSITHIPRAALALGVYGLLGFHVCYFFALQNAPPLEASLIVYLWPLFIVIFSSALPARHGGTRLRWWHVVGALMGFSGSIVLLLPDMSLNRSAHLDATRVVGYALAFAAAVIWSTYSVGLRAFAAVPSVGVIASCAATAIGASVLHALTESWTWPRDPTAWLAIAALGIGPTGLAFYLWDDGMKRGNMRLLGVLSYATPLASTLMLIGLGVGLGMGTGHSGLWAAAALITAGALLAGTGAHWFERRAGTNIRL